MLHLFARAAAGMVFAALLALASPVWGQAAPGTSEKSEKSDAVPEPPLAGDELARGYLREETAKIQSGGLIAGLSSAADFEAARERLRQEYLDMLGLWPLPERTPLAAQTTGTLERDGYRMEKIHFQSRPGLYVTSNLYLPAKVEGKLPAVLYLCGHSGRGRDGNKAAFQHHGQWFATHGYACLIVDTLQLGEVAGIHHGTYRYNRWWWQARGYTPAGVECWNGIRAIDYLTSRSEVDGEKIAATGISGGGAATFWIAAADPRVKVAVPVSGMGDLETYVTDGVIDGHCDCMLLINRYRWEWTSIAALVAPRPLLFQNSDHDTIFPMSGNDRIAGRLRKLYALLGRPEAFDTFVVPGGHEDKPALRLAAYRWINRWLKGENGEVTEPQLPAIEGKDLRVFPGDFPADAINDRIDETFVPRAAVAPPSSAAEFPAWRDGLLRTLKEVTFSAGEEKLLVVDFKAPEPPKPDPSKTESSKGEASKPGTSKEEKPLWILVPGLGDTETAWADEITKGGERVVFHPRGVGPSAWSVRSPHYVERALALVGRTADGGRVWDVVHAARAAREKGHRGRLGVIGRGAAGIIALYAALLEPAIDEVAAVDPPRSHREGPILIDVMRVWDIPEALGALAPRPLTLQNADGELAKKVKAIYEVAVAKEKLVIKK